MSELFQKGTQRSNESMRNEWLTIDIVEIPEVDAI